MDACNHYLLDKFPVPVGNFIAVCSYTADNLVQQAVMARTTPYGFYKLPGPLVIFDL